MFTLAQLQALGGVAPPITYTDLATGNTFNGVVPGEVRLSWLKTVDVSFAWVGTFKERFTVKPGVSFYNVFNLLILIFPAAS